MQLCWLLCYLTVVSATPLSHETETDASNTIFNIIVSDRIFPSNDVCTTKHCENIARSILSNRNTSVNPCDDFYEYACGSWSTNHPIPPTEVSWSQDDLITMKLYNRLRVLLEAEDEPNDIRPVKLARQLYRSCMDTENIEKKGVKPIQEILDTQGGWPIAMPLDHWDAAVKTWQEIDMDYLKMFGSTAFFNMNYDIDDNNTDRYILTIDADLKTPITGLQRKKFVLFKPEHRYMNGIAHIVKEFLRVKGYRVRVRQLIQDIIDMVAFEYALITPSQDEAATDQSGKEAERMTIDELQKWYDKINVHHPKTQINFLPVIQNIFKLADISVNGSEQILVRNKPFFNKLAHLLQNTTRRTIVNYVHWDMVSNLLPYTSEDMRLTKYDMSPFNLNVTEDLPRWHVCVHLMQMKHATSYMFVKEYFSDTVIHKVKDMVYNIEDVFGKRISNAKWIPDKMKTFMKEKLNHLLDLVAYPEWYKNTTVLINRYRKLKIGKDYFQNILNSRKNDLLRILSEFRLKADRRRWEDYPVTVNAFYSSNLNIIVLPAAILQEPYFTHFLPDAVNYGTIGFAVGHELSHSFDKEGMQHDKTGHKVTWSQDNDFQGYEDRVTCFVDQYNNFTLDIINEIGEPLTVNGHLTADENMADTTGLQAAFAAFKQLKMTNKHQLKLPGLEDTTDEQLFFLSYANAWCSTENPEYVTAMVENDEHSPSRYRIIGSLINSKEFTETFNCPLGSPMNQPKRCTLWN